MMTQYFQNQFSTRPWGCWQILDPQPHAVIKRLVVNPHSSLSLQRHQYRTEHWIVIEGEASITLEDRHMVLKPADFAFIPQRAWHRLSNEGDMPLVVVEIQMGSLLSEEDIERAALPTE